jgi:hypothetical protein
MHQRETQQRHPFSFLIGADMRGETRVLDMRLWRNWYTRTFEGRVSYLIRVQVPSIAPKAPFKAGLFKFSRQLHMRVWRNWQTRKIQVLMVARLCRFKSCYPHQLVWSKKMPCGSSRMASPFVGALPPLFCVYSRHCYRFVAFSVLDKSNRQHLPSARLIRLL